MMTTHPLITFTNPFLEEAEADMRRLGFDPTKPEAWRRYALVLFRDRKLLPGMPSPDNDEIIEISKTVHARLRTFAEPAVRLIAKLREIDDQYRAIKRPHQQDALEDAIAALSFLTDILDCFSVGPLGGLPTPLLLVLADLINVSQGRLGRLVSPDDDVVAAANEVADSSKDRARLTIQAYAAATVHRIVERKQLRSKEEAYRRWPRHSTRWAFARQENRSQNPSARTQSGLGRCIRRPGFVA